MSWAGQGEWGADYSAYAGCGYGAWAEGWGSSSASGGGWGDWSQGKGDGKGWPSASSSWSGGMMPPQQAGVAKSGPPAWGVEPFMNQAVAPSLGGQVPGIGFAAAPGTLSALVQGTSTMAAAPQDEAAPSAASLEEQLQEQAKAAIMKLQRDGPPPDDDEGPSPAVMEEQLQDLRTRFGLDDRVFAELREVMQRRAPSFHQDMQMLYGQLGNARHPPGLLLVKLRELKMTTPVPVRPAPPKIEQPPPDPAVMQGEIMSLVTKFNLDDRIRVRLNETLLRRANTFWDDMATLRDIMGTARNPPGLLSVKLTEMEQGRFIARGGTVGPPATQVIQQAPVVRQQSMEMCGDFRRGVCSRGDRCKFSHGNPVPPGGPPSSVMAALAEKAGLPPGSVAGMTPASQPGVPGGFSAGSRFSEGPPAPLGFSDSVGGPTSSRAEALLGRKRRKSSSSGSDRRKRSRSESRRKSRSRRDRSRGRRDRSRDRSRDRRDRRRDDRRDRRDDRRDRERRDRSKSRDQSRDDKDKEREASPKKAEKPDEDGPAAAAMSQLQRDIQQQLVEEEEKRKEKQKELELQLQRELEAHVEEQKRIEQEKENEADSKETGKAKAKDAEAKSSKEKKKEKPEKQKGKEKPKENAKEKKDEKEKAKEKPKEKDTKKEEKNDKGKEKQKEKEVSKEKVKQKENSKDKQKVKEKGKDKKRSRSSDSDERKDKKAKVKAKA